MSQKIGPVILICEEPDDVCTQCGNVAETRPYGPGYTRVCFECAMKDKEGTDRRMGHKLFGDPDSESGTN